MLAIGVLAVAVGLFVAVFGLVVVRDRVTVGAAEAPTSLVEDDPDATPKPGLAYRAFEPVFIAGGELVRRLAPKARVELTRKRIIYAGLEQTWTVEKAFGMRAVAAVVGFAFGLFIHPKSVPAILAAIVVAAVASFVPDVLLDSRANERQHKIARGLPDALDLLAITVEAGLGLEQGLDVVSSRMTGPLGDELNRMLREIELGVPRRQALGLLRERTNVSELSAFVVALLQADELGVSIGDVLKVQASQVRLVRTQKAREQAAKTPVKILFPLIIGIFPALFVVTIGPGAITIVHSLFHNGTFG